MLQPPTPPPMITTRACVGRSAILYYLLEPLRPTVILDIPGQTLEMFIRIPPEIEFQFGNANLYCPPHGLPVIGDNAHHFQARPVFRGHLSEVTGQQDAVMLVGEIVVDRQVGEIEIEIAHASILPIQDTHLAIEEKICVQKVIVAWAPGEG